MLPDMVTNRDPIGRASRSVIAMVAIRLARTLSGVLDAVNLIIKQATPSSATRKLNRPLYVEHLFHIGAQEHDTRPE